jgi:hypothetical protein
MFRHTDIVNRSTVLTDTPALPAINWTAVGQPNVLPATLLGPRLPSLSPSFSDRGEAQRKKG